MSEKKLTAIQELIERFTEFQSQSLEHAPHLFGVWFFNNAEVLLEKEREVIEEAYNQGYRDGEIETIDNYEGDISEFDDANQYFNETFKTKE